MKYLKSPFISSAILSTIRICYFYRTLVTLVERTPTHLLPEIILIGIKSTYKYCGNGLQSAESKTSIIHI